MEFDHKRFRLIDARKIRDLYLAGWPLKAMADMALVMKRKASTGI